MEYKLIAENSDMALACERARSSYHRPTLNSPAAAPLRVRINQHLYFIICQGPGILMTDVLFLDILFWEQVRLSTVPLDGVQGTVFCGFLDTIRCLRSRITWMRRLESYNLVRYVAAVANGLLRMCVDASVENSAFPHQHFRLQLRTWFPMQEHHSWGQRLVAAVKGSVLLTNQIKPFGGHLIHFSLRKAYLSCGTRVLGKVSATC
jgi:hypothetical protein